MRKIVKRPWKSEMIALFYQALIHYLDRIKSHKKLEIEGDRDKWTLFPQSTKTDGIFNDQEIV